MHAKNSFTYVEDSSGLTSVGIRSLFKATRGASHSEDLWYNETLYLLRTKYTWSSHPCFEHFGGEICLLPYTLKGSYI